MPTDETLYVITEGDETPQQVMLNFISDQIRTWKGPYRDPKLAEAYAHQYIRAQYNDPPAGHIQIHTFQLTNFHLHAQNTGATLHKAA